MRLWLKNLPKDIETAKRHIQKVESINLPDAIKSEYLEKFRAHDQRLTRTREELEGAQATCTYDSVDLRLAHAQVLKLTSDAKEWKSVAILYGIEKPEPSKKKKAEE